MIKLIAFVDGSSYSKTVCNHAAWIAGRVDVSVNLVPIDDRRLTAERLTAGGIGFGIHYPTPVHRMPAYGFLGYGEGYLPLTEAACASVMSLPLHPGLSTAEVELICHTLKEA